MAIKFLCKTRLEDNKNSLEFAVHPEATHFRCRSGEMYQYRVNPDPSKDMRDIPLGANTMTFKDIRKHRGWVEYGVIEFYSVHGNLLKAEKY